MSCIPFLYLIPAAVIGLLWLLARGETLPESGGEKVDGIRGQFVRIGQFLYRTLPVFKKPGHGAQVASSLGVLEPRVSADEAKRLSEIFLRMIKGSVTEDELDELEEAGSLIDISHMPARVDRKSVV